MPQLKIQNFRGWQTLVNKDVGYAPYFSSALRYRIGKKLATNICVTGEPGIGKSYQAIDIARICEGITRQGNDRFKLRQVVFTYREYLHLIINLGMGKIIVFDEPSYAMGKRDWYKDLNKALVLTIESQRFKVHPLLIPIINQALLDKTIRSYLIQYQIHVVDRGLAKVYRIYAGQHQENIYRYFLCNLEYEMLDSDLCERDSCLDCDKLMQCELFRAAYERKKATIQDRRYQSAYDDVAKKESKDITDNQLAQQLYEIRSQFLNEQGGIDTTLMRVVSERELGVRISHMRSYKLRKILQLDYPEAFT